MELPPGVVYASFWRRVLASLIDTVLLMLMIFIIISVLSATTAFSFAPQMMDFPSFFDLLFLVIIVLMWLKYGATPGKMILDCKIVDARTGGKLSVGQSIIRYLGYIVSTIPLMLGFIWVAFSPRKQGFHDMLARTVVIHSPNQVIKEDLSNKPIDKLMKEFE